MPPRQRRRQPPDVDQVRRELAQFGYTLPMTVTRIKNVRQMFTVFDEQAQQRARLSITKFKYLKKHGRPEYNPYHVLPVNERHMDEKDRTSLGRFIQRQGRNLANKSDKFKKDLHHLYTVNIANMVKERDFKFRVDQENYEASLTGFLLAVRDSLHRLKKEVILTIRKVDGSVTYAYANDRTIDFLAQVVQDEEDLPEIADSDVNILEALVQVDEVDVEFRNPTPGRRIMGGCFPYFNTFPGLDLSKYGIFDRFDIANYDDNCVVLACKESGRMTTEELNYLRSIVRTRVFPRSALKEICRIFNVAIKTWVYYDEDNSFSHHDFGFDPFHPIKLVLWKGHYMLNEKVNVTEFYIRNRKRIETDPRFAQHPRKRELIKVSGSRYTFSKDPYMPIISVIKLLMQEGYMTPMTDEQYRSVAFHWKPFNEELKFCPAMIIPLTAPAPNYGFIHSHFGHPEMYGKWFFGYTPCIEDVPTRLDDLQRVVKEIMPNATLNVRFYTKASELMQAIMQLYGCFEGCYAVGEPLAAQIKEKVLYPAPHTFNRHPLLCFSDLYYVDLNGAYLSCIEGIPMGKDLLVDDVTDLPMNTKIRELVEKLYWKRKDVESSNPYLAKTLKVLATSCWGYSAKRPKMLQNKYTQNLKKRIETHAPMVLSYKNVGGEAGVTTEVLPTSINYTYPQFALAVLTKFNRLMAEIVQMGVRPLYYNIDAILINRKDYDLLEHVGMVGQRLGQFKLDKVFTKIYIRSARKYVARLKDGTFYYHCIPKEEMEYLKTQPDPVEAYFNMTRLRKPHNPE